MTAPLCSLCAQQHRGPRPMPHTASGVWVCPICDRNIPHQPTDAHGVLLAVLSTTSAALGRGVLNASRDLGYLTGELQRPEPDTYTRHRDAITGQYIDADEAAARPETTIRETRKP